METQLPCGKLVYRRTGHGPDVVMLHGLLGGAAQWGSVAAGWAEQYTCWMPELPGISMSDRLCDSSITGLRQWLEQAASALDWRNATLIASSWGGAVAMAMAADSPERQRLRRLVLVAPVHPYWKPSLRQRLLLSPGVARTVAWLGARASPEVHRRVLATSYGDARRVDQHSVDAYGATLQQRGLGAAIAAYGRHLHRDMQALAVRLPYITFPVQLIWGDADRVVPPATAAALEHALPDGRITVLTGLGHLPFAEDPAAFAAALQPFLG